MTINIHQSAPPEKLDIEVKKALQTKIKAGASWFYWIAALSLFNTVIFHFLDNGTTFVVGWGVTQFADAVIGFLIPELRAEYVNYFIALNVFIDVVCIGLFILIGWLANANKKIVYLVGMILYLLDGLFLFLFNEYAGIGFHAFALFWLFRGFQALLELEKMDKEIVAEIKESSSAITVAATRLELNSVLMIVFWITVPIWMAIYGAAVYYGWPV